MNCRNGGREDKAAQSRLLETGRERWGLKSLRVAANASPSQLGGHAWTLGRAREMTTFVPAR